MEISKQDKKKAEKKLRDLLARLKDSGISEGYYIFLTTLEHYFKQLDILDSLYQIYQEKGPQVEGPKGELMINPAVREYRGYVAGLTTTAKTLTSIMKDFGASPEEVDEWRVFFEENGIGGKK